MSMAISVQQRIVKNETFWDFKGKVDYVDDWFLMGTPVPVFMIMTAYLLFVLKVGPAYMQNKQALNLKYALVIYNVAQIGLSCYLCVMGSKIILTNGLIQQSCLLNDKYNQIMITSAIHIYVIAKLTELMDTVFFVLRKNYRQITFLHVYHHSMMLASTWLTLKYEPNNSIVFLGTLNSFIHIVMYTYYCLSAFSGLSKYLWWKKYITKMQIMQFVLIIIQVVPNYLLSECPPSYTLLTFILFNAIIFIMFFTNFYVSSYNQSKKIE